MTISNLVRFNSIPGWVYIIHIKSPDEKALCRIGATTRNPLSRCSEWLNSQSSKQLEMFETPSVYYSSYVHSIFQVEHLAHQMLHEHAVNISGDVFDIDPDAAVTVLKSAIEVISIVTS